MKPKISIIIPVYNIEKYIKKCLQSIQSQTFTEFEALIVNDGSSDHTGEVCDKFAKADSRFRVIHKANEGVSVARNTAIVQAQGEYLLFFDGDDYVVNTCLEELYSIAKEKRVDAVLYGYYLVENEEIKETHLPRFQKNYYEGKEILEKVVPKFIGVSYNDIKRWLSGDADALKKENTALWRSMVKTSVILDNHILFERGLKVGEDTCFTTEYLSNIENCYIVQKCFYHLVVRDTSTIYVYEKNPEAVLNGKIDLLSSRRKLTERIKKKRGFDIEPFWYGTVVMSCIQLAFLLSNNNAKQSYQKRYQLLQKYIRQPETLRAIKKFPKISSGGIKKIPFLLLKRKAYGTLFLATSILNKMNYTFQR